MIIYSRKISAQNSKNMFLNEKVEIFEISLIFSLGVQLGKPTGNHENFKNFNFLAHKIIFIISSMIFHEYMIILHRIYFAETLIHHFGSRGLGPDCAL